MTKTTHELKTWPEYYQQVKSGAKTFELREDDRSFQVGDTLLLLEYDAKERRYTGDHLLKKVTYKLMGGVFGLDEGYCILGLGETDEAKKNDKIEKVKELEELLKRTNTIDYLTQRVEYIEKVLKIEG